MKAETRGSEQNEKQSTSGCSDGCGNCCGIFRSLGNGEYSGRKSREQLIWGLHNFLEMAMNANECNNECKSALPQQGPETGAAGAVAAVAAGVSGVSAASRTAWSLQ